MECDGEAGTWDSADEEQQYWYDHVEADTTP